MTALRLRAPDDSAALPELSTELIDHPHIRLIDPVPRPGDRGVGLDIIAEPTGIAGIVALTRLLSIWLRRDKGRSITVERLSASGEKDVVHIEGENISLGVIEQALTTLTETAAEHEEGEEKLNDIARPPADDSRPPIQE